MWWRLAMPCPPELEESLLWKLNEGETRKDIVQAMIDNTEAAGYWNVFNPTIKAELLKIAASE